MIRAKHARSFILDKKHRKADSLQLDNVSNQVSFTENSFSDYEYDLNNIKHVDLLCQGSHISNMMQAKHGRSSMIDEQLRNKHATNQVSFTENSFSGFEFDIENIEHVDLLCQGSHISSMLRAKHARSNMLDKKHRNKKHRRNADTLQFDKAGYLIEPSKLNKRNELHCENSTDSDNHSTNSANYDPITALNSIPDIPPNFTSRDNEDEDSKMAELPDTSNREPLPGSAEWIARSNRMRHIIHDMPKKTNEDLIRILEVEDPGPDHIISQNNNTYERDMSHNQANRDNHVADTSLPSGTTNLCNLLRASIVRDKFVNGNLLENYEGPMSGNEDDESDEEIRITFKRLGRSGYEQLKTSNITAKRKRKKKRNKQRKYHKHKGKRNKRKRKRRPRGNRLPKSLAVQHDPS